MPRLGEQRDSHWYLREARHARYKADATSDPVLRDSYLRVAEAYENGRRRLHADAGQQDKPFTRFTASTFLIVGSALSLVGGLYIGSFMQYYVIFKDLPYLFGQTFRLDLLFYPPIAVLIVDTMHTVASKID